MAKVKRAALYVRNADTNKGKMKMGSQLDEDMKTYAKENGFVVIEPPKESKIYEDVLVLDR